MTDEQKRPPAWSRREPDWVEVACSGGCGKLTPMPPDDPLAKGWTCVGCEYANPTFSLPNKTDTGGPEMTDTKDKIPTPNSGPCGCGCGTVVKGKYAQGHDAKHVSKLVAEVLDKQRSRSSALRQIESIALKEKLRRSLDRAEAQQAKARKDAGK